MDLINRARRPGGICWYPSCGADQLRLVMELSSAVFLFSDFEQNFDTFASGFDGEGPSFSWIHRGECLGSFRLGDKWGFYFSMDNRALFDILRLAQLSLSCFVGLNDGCCEGGNDACVHEEPFLTNLLSLAASPLCYITDHSPLLKRLPMMKPGFILSANVPFEQQYYREHLNYGSWRFSLHSLLVIPCFSNPINAGRRRWEIEFEPDDVELLNKSLGLRRSAREITPELWGRHAWELSRLWPYRYNHNRMALYTVTRKDAV